MTSVHPLLILPHRQVFPNISPPPDEPGQSAVEASMALLMEQQGADLDEQD
jgi:hypothetical protein